MTALLQLLVPLCWALSAAGLAWYCINLSGDITYVTLADGRRQARALPFVFKLLLPFAPNLRGFIAQPAFRASVEKADARLVTAGFEGLLSGWEFIALRFLCPVVLGLFWTALIYLVGHVDETVREQFAPLALLGFALFAAQPVLWLNATIKKRHKAIQKAMPFMIDLLTLSVEAGIDFMNALQRSLENRKTDPLTEELVRVNHEIQLGTSRRNALKNLAKRVDMPDMRSFAYALIQADELGVSIGTILRIQSDQIRQKRFDRAEKMANEAPVKMLGPLMLFIFPAVFIVLLGPILSRVAGGMM
ncbi:MAG: type II secretion system F family protein [Kiritimatiellae bacterium]|nr:type II secretion system F family protein [Kiritimatiellia bacterium]